jgi:hypothetical protein
LKLKRHWFKRDFDSTCKYIFVMHMDNQEIFYYRAQIATSWNRDEIKQMSRIVWILCVYVEGLRRTLQVFAGSI